MHKCIIQLDYCICQKKPRRVHLESDDEEEVGSVQSVDTIRSRMRRGGKRMEMIRPHLTQQQQEAVDEEGLYSDSDQEAETQSRTSTVQVRMCVLSVCIYHPQEHNVDLV